MPSPTVVNLRDPIRPAVQDHHGGMLPRQYGPHARIDDPHYQIIPGSHGHVYAWGTTRLAASTNTPGSTASKLKALPGVEVWQDGSDGCTVLFAVDLLDQVADLLRLRRRRQVTDEERKRLSTLGHRHRFQPQQRGLQSNSRPALAFPCPKPTRKPFAEQEGPIFIPRGPIKGKTPC